MSETPSSINWEARFRAEDAPWERAGVHPAVEYWRRKGAIVEGQSLYIPGCGRGSEPLALAKAGIDVTVSDLAPSAATFQRDALSNHSTAVIVEGDSLSWRPSAPFDVLYEQTFLCAIHPRKRRDYERMAYEVLRPGGRLLALFMQKEQPGGPPYGCAPPAMRELFPKERWAWQNAESTASFPHPNLNGKPELAYALTRL